MTAYVQFKTLTCNTTTESGPDEVYIEYNGTKVWPSDKWYEVKEKDSVDLKEKIPHLYLVQGRGHIRVMEYDDASPNDLIGEVWPSENEAGKGPQTSNLTGDSGNYDLTYEVISV